MAEKFDYILKALNQVDFHNIPVKGVNVEIDDKLIVRIDYFLYTESKKDYDEYSLVFSEIETVKFQEFTIKKGSDLEIASFDYNIVNNTIKCRVLFLIGFAEASIDLEIDCGNIEIKKNEHNNTYTPLLKSRFE